MGEAAGVGCCPCGVAVTAWIGVGASADTRILTTRFSIAVPSVIGMMIGARIGARLLTVVKASVVRKLVLTLLLFAGLRALLKGLGIWN